MSSQRLKAYKAVDTVLHQHGGPALTGPEDTELVTELKVLLEKGKLITDPDSESDEESSQETTRASYHNKLAQTISILNTYITCLMDLLPSMEKTLSYTKSPNLDKTPPQVAEFHVSGPAKAYVLRVYDRFQRADSRLVKRLGEANWQRHIALRKTQEYEHDGLEVVQAAVKELAPVARDKEAPRSVFIPVSLFNDSGIGSSVPAARSSYAATTVSHSSFVSSLAQDDHDGLRVPPTPKEVLSGIPFTCDICGHILSRITNRVDWKYVIFILHSLHVPIKLIYLQETRFRGP